MSWIDSELRFVAWIISNRFFYYFLFSKFPSIRLRRPSKKHARKKKMSFALGRESLPASWGRYFPPQLLLQVPRWQRRRRLVGTPQSEANELNTVINATSVGRRCRRRRSPPAIFLTGERKKVCKGLGNQEWRLMARLRIRSKRRFHWAPETDKKKEIISIRARKRRSVMKISFEEVYIYILFYFYILRLNDLNSQVYDCLFLSPRWRLRFSAAGRWFASLWWLNRR